ncbi:hypothetical protein I3J27_24830 [Bradyrhizobium xenonodulans]|uniref:Transposase n=1 Tax=Bradyrhizobium xenonodulans TaxID=2736875 RepID=A0ABY7MW70_9BRAD|nr:hypothetical protein I3J27_24830 [Bradyrhizobium xenonodulans]
MQKRRRFRHPKSLEERLADEAKALREAANALPPGVERECMLLKARRDETALHITEWLTSPGLRPPT